MLQLSNPGAVGGVLGQQSCAIKPGTEEDARAAAESVGLCLESFASRICLRLAGGAGCPPEQGEGSQALCRARGSPSHVLFSPGWLKSLHRRWVALHAPLEVSPATREACISRYGFLHMHPASEAGGAGMKGCLSLFPSSSCCFAWLWR